MMSLVLASKPLVETTLKAYMKSYDSLQIERNMTHDVIRINAINLEMGTLKELIQHTEQVLKNMGE